VVDERCGAVPSFVRQCPRLAFPANIPDSNLLLGSGRDEIAIRANRLRGDRVVEIRVVVIHLMSTSPGAAVPVETRHNLSVPPDSVARRVPPATSSESLTSFSCLATNCSRPVSTSHVRAVPSAEALTTSLPSGVYDAWLTAF